MKTDKEAIKQLIKKIQFRTQHTSYEINENEFNPDFKEHKTFTVLIVKEKKLIIEATISAKNSMLCILKLVQNSKLNRLSMVELVALVIQQNRELLKEDNNIYILSTCNR